MITIGYCTRTMNPKFQEYLQKTCMYNNVQIIEKVNNGERGLSEVYNEIISESKYDIVVLCHDDIEFETKNWGDKLLKVFSKTDYGIIGVAGTTYLPESGKWWERRESMRGIVNHKKNGKKWESKYSPNEGKISDVVAIDGVFMVFNKTKISFNFDETFDGFHFYDIPFCLLNYINGVKIGVTYDVRLTHLSIGETNEKWEENRSLFMKKYIYNLPQKYEDECDLTTYIMCHDQEIIKSNIQSGKFNKLGNVIFMYVGKGQFDEIENFPNVIITRDLKYNIEQYPMFTAFTAWYAIWKNKLCKSKYINLLEYDVNLNDDYSFHLKNVIKQNPKVIGYFPFSMKNYHYVNNSNWVSSIFKGIQTFYKINMERYVNDYIESYIKSTNGEPIWPSTNNICFKYSTFETYMNWVNPLISFMKESEFSGHNQERAISFFCLLTKTPVYYYTDQMVHIQSDSHKTQGHIVTKTLDL